MARKLRGGDWDWVGGRTRDLPGDEGSPIDGHPARPAQHGTSTRRHGHEAARARRARRHFVPCRHYGLSTAPSTSPTKDFRAVPARWHDGGPTCRRARANPQHGRGGR
jgi:hypothetical protein